MRGLGRLAPGEKSVSGKRIATTVFFGRRINGIAVAGDKLALTFFTRGKLAAIAGHWSPIDFARSRLGCTATSQEITQIAVNILMPRALSLAPASEISVRLAYFPERDAEGVGVIDLRGVVDVAVQGPSGGRAREIYDFAL